MAEDSGRIEGPLDRMLVDQRHRPLRDLRISVTDRCNFRCGYCMPKDIFGKGYAFLKSKELLSYEEISTLVGIFSHLGVSKIRLTGGEPLLRKDLEKLIRRISVLEGIDDIALTTNASLLTPDRADSLKQAGISRVNISLDALSPQIYQQINQIPYPMEDILNGVDAALNAGFETVKINMVVQRDINVDDIVKMSEYFRGTGAILRFIEFMDVGNYNQWSLDKVFSAKEIVALIHQHYPLEPLKENYTGEVAKRWRYVDGQGEIGVISSITQPFCGDCARARLSAIGELYTCLFASQGHDLRALLRQGGTSGQELMQIITNIWQGRSDQYSMERSAQQGSPGVRVNVPKVEMSYIGG